MHDVTAFQKHRLDYLSILLIVAAGSLALFFKIGEVPPSYPWSDESEIAADAVDTLRNGPQLFYPGQLAGGSLAVWLEAGWMALFGKSLLGLRLLNGLINLGSAVLLSLLVRQLPQHASRSTAETAFSRPLALTAALLFAVSTWLLGLGRIAAPNWSLVPLMTVLAFYCFWLGLKLNRRRYFLAAGVVMGLLFYGYVPGYFVPLVPALFLGLTWIIGRSRVEAATSTANRNNLTSLLLFPTTLLIAAPILIYFAVNPAATLQRPLQLVDTNELSSPGSIAQGAIDLLSTFGLYPNWLLQGRFEHLAFDPLVTVLFVAGLLVALWHWREPAHLFLLLWWAVMVAPALLSRSASQGFIFEVWRRGVGAQPVSFVLAASGLFTLTNLQIRRSETKEQGSGGAKDESPLAPPLIRPFILSLPLVIASAGLSYWLYFERWAHSDSVPALFAEAPVRMVEWMETTGQAGTLFIFPIRPNVSPTTRPELFTVRYLYDGQAATAFPVLDETTIDRTLTGLLHSKLTTVKLMLSDRLAVDPKGYFEYALGSQGELVAREQLPDYVVTTYRLGRRERLDRSFEANDVVFGDALRLTGQRVQAGQLAAGQILGIALRWIMERPDEVDYNVSLTLSDGQNYAWVKVDKPLLSAGDYLTTRHWSPGAASTVYFALPLPPDAPAGRYTVRVVAYDAETGIQLPPVGGRADLSWPLVQINLLPNPTAVEPATLAIAHPLDTQLSGGLRLIGAETSAAATARPGDRLWVTLFWQATRPLPQDMGLLLALVAPAQKPAPLFEQPQPLIAGYPTSAWRAGQVYRANYRVLLPARLTGGDYRLALRLVNLDTVEPLADQVLFSLPIEARSHIFEASALANQVNVDFGDLIRLLGFEIEGASPELTPGTPIRLKLQWQALREMRDSYKIFVHLTDAASRVISQLDTLPQQGAAPTSGWVPGEIIEDELVLTVPSKIPSGSYRLVVGLYNEKTGERLAAGQSDQVELVERMN